MQLLDGFYGFHDAEDAQSASTAQACYRQLLWLPPLATTTTTIATTTAAAATTITAAAAAAAIIAAVFPAGVEPRGTCDLTVTREGNAIFADIAGYTLRHRHRPRTTGRPPEKKIRKEDSITYISKDAPLRRR